MDELMSWLGHPSTWITVLIIGTMGEVAKVLILGPKKSWPRDADGHFAFRGWRGAYAATYKVHALAVGALLGFVPGVPVITALQSDGVAGAVLQYSGNGALAMVAYASLVGTIKGVIERYGRRFGVDGG
ncbi:MAG: hypothetical protein J0L92_00995 [Deltaproteobacteria bacterium]|nr:hypothetical protein [Deltaproteobacteria bacterium]